MKILMCCHLPLKSTLGGAKVYIEAAKCYEMSGHQVDLVGIDQICPPDSPILDESWRLHYFPEHLKKYIETHLDNFDVIEFEAPYLPLPINNPENKIIVARSVLLELHLLYIKIPSFGGIRAWLGKMLKGRARHQKLLSKINQILTSIKHAHFVNVPNPDDRDVLIKHGVSESKIIVQPYGIFESRKSDLQREHLGFSTTKTHTIAFVGTFDNRKGAVEFPQIIREIISKHPQVKFKLLGVLAMFPDEKSIYDYIGHDLRSHVEIVGSFDAKDLPTYLRNCTIGIFPSHLESFGFGALEMMAAGIPVIGYSCPGVRSLLPRENLVERGDVGAFINRLDHLLRDFNHYQNCLHHLKEAVDHYIYERQENLALKKYASHQQQ